MDAKCYWYWYYSVLDIITKWDEDLCREQSPSSKIYRVTKRRKGERKAGTKRKRINRCLRRQFSFVNQRNFIIITDSQKYKSKLQSTNVKSHSFPIFFGNGMVHEGIFLEIVFWTPSRSARSIKCLNLT